MTAVGKRWGTRTRDREIRAAARNERTAEWQSRTGPLIQSLRADPSGHFLVTEDGKPFLWQGDTLWGALSLGPADIDYYLDTRKAQGFNVVQLMAHRNDYVGNPPFAQTNPVRLHEAHWAYIDSIVAKAATRNMYVCLFLMWGQNADSLFPDPYTNNYQYGKLLGQRYATNNAVIFAGSGEYHKITAPPDDWKIPLTPEQITLVARIGEGLEEGHGGRRLNTMHPNAGGAKQSTGSSLLCSSRRNTPRQHEHSAPRKPRNRRTPGLALPFLALVTSRILRFRPGKAPIAANTCGSSKSHPTTPPL